MREKFAFGILVFLLIFLFAFVFAILGRGEYQPSPEEGVGPAPIVSTILA